MQPNDGDGVFTVNEFLEVKGPFEWYGAADENVLRLSLGMVFATRTAAQDAALAARDAMAIAPKDTPDPSDIDPNVDAITAQDVQAVDTAQQSVQLSPKKLPPQ